MERFEEQAIVLSAVDYGDADRVVTLFTRGRGKLSAFAAGARKSRRRFSGALEPGTYVLARLADRRGEMVWLDGVDIQNTFHALRQDLSRISRALYCLELCRELVREREPHPRLFSLLSSYLELLSANGAGPTSLLAFELAALAQGGLMPSFRQCAICSGSSGERPRFEPSHGGVVCEGCAARAPYATRVAAPVIEALALLQQGVRQKLPPELRRQARDLLNLFIAHHLGRKLKSVDFLHQLGLD